MTNKKENQKKENMDNDMLTRKEAVAYLRIDQSTLHRWEKRGIVRRKGGLGNKVYYSKQALDRALTANR